MRKLGNIIYFTSISFLFCSCNFEETPSPVQIKKLDYPSASAVEYVNGRLYVMGDDATDLLVLDTNLNIIDSIQVISYAGRRIPKEIKPDIEASFIDSHRNTNLVLLGSLSDPLHRQWCWSYDFNNVSANSGSGSMQILYSKIKTSGIEQINIEGACVASDNLIVANRGNKSYTKNHLIVGPKALWRADTDTTYPIIITQVIVKSDTSAFSGISGLCYLDNDNKLIMSVSTEDTRSVYEDGAIGKSYLWIINDFSIKSENKIINPDRIIELEEIDKKFKGYKIESVTMISETNESLRLVLVADNDDGSSTIFKVNLKK